MQEGQVIDVFRSDPILTCCRQLQNVQVARTSQYHILHQSSSSSAQLEKLNVDFPVSCQLSCWLHPSLYDFNFLWNWLGYSPSLNSQKCVVKFHKMFSRINLHFCERSKNTNLVVSLKKTLETCRCQSHQYIQYGMEWKIVSANLSGIQIRLEDFDIIPTFFLGSTSDGV